MTPADEALVAAAVYAERATIQRILRRMRIPPDAGEDLTQILVMSAVHAAREGRLEWRHRAPLRAWIHVSLTRLARRWRKLRRREAGEPHADGDPIIDPMPQIEARDELRRIRRSTTGEELRLLMAIVDGATVAEIAAERGVPFGTAATWIRRVRKNLR